MSKLLRLIRFVFVELVWQSSSYPLYYKWLSFKRLT